MGACIESNLILDNEELSDFASFCAWGGYELKHAEKIDKEAKEKMLKILEKLSRFLDDSRFDKEESIELTLRNHGKRSPAN
jgi:hypothetical protein